MSEVVAPSWRTPDDRPFMGKLPRSGTVYVAREWYAWHTTAMLMAHLAWHRRPAFAVLFPQILGGLVVHDNAPPPRPLSPEASAQEV